MAADIGVTLALSACVVIDSGRVLATSVSDVRVALPIINCTETPRAGLRAETIAASIFEVRGSSNLEQYPAGLNSKLPFEPAEHGVVSHAPD